MRLVSLASVLAVAIGALWVGPVSAGGWAVTTLDSLPSSVYAGQAYEIGYTIRQHGVTPFTAAKPRIVISLDGQTLSFAGLPHGQPGHYVSDVEFPRAGTWTLAVDQMPFAIQALGTLQILVPSAPAAEAVTTARGEASTNPTLVSAGVADGAHLIPWAWAWLAAGSVLALGLVGLRFRRAE